MVVGASSRGDGCGDYSTEGDWLILEKATIPLGAGHAHVTPGVYTVGLDLTGDHLALALEQVQQLLGGHVGIAQELPEQAAPHVLPGMHGHGYHATIGALEASMATALVGEHEPSFLQGTQQSGRPEHGQGGWIVGWG